MAVTRGTSVAGNSGGLGTGFTIASVTCSGSDRYLVVSVAFSATGASVSSVTFNTSEALTFVDARNAGSGGTQCRVERWALVAPSATTANIAVVTSSAISCGIAVPYSGVDQATPRDATVKGNGADTAPTLTAAFAWGGGGDSQAMSVAWRNGTYTFTADAGVTQVQQTTSGSGSSHVGLAILSDADTETGKVMGALSTSTGWGIIGVNLNEVSAGGSSIAAISAGYHNQGLR